MSPAPAVSRSHARRRASGAACLLVVAMLPALAACGGAPILANAPVVRAQPPAAPSASARPSDPVPLVFPRDDGPHDRLTEWWYYTGHLADASGHHFGFEYVIFRAERGALPISWASHLAITDESGNRFVYAQRSEIGPQVDRSPRASDGSAEGFSLALVGFDPSHPAQPAGPPWAMAGANGEDRLSAQASSTEAAAAGSPGGLGLALDLATEKPPALHDGIGWIDFGAAGNSYYYSRTRMAARGSLSLDGRTIPVQGTAWFDHQWGDFIAVGGGGWDWFAIELADGTDVTLSMIRALDGSYPLEYGTLVRPDGTTVHLDRGDFTVSVTDHWTSPRTGASYPAGWRIELTSQGLSIELHPTVAAQELDTRPTTGVVYWEGSQRVQATRNGRPLGGEAYVELTGYAAR